MPQHESVRAKADVITSRLTEDEKTRLITDLMNKDPCLMSIVQSVSPDFQHTGIQKEEVNRLLREHDVLCGGRCMHRVVLKRDCDPDPGVRWGYRVIAAWAMVAWIHRYGGEHRVVSTNEGKVTTTRFPQNKDLPFPPPYSVIEVYEPADSTKTGHVTFEVESEALFNDPRLVLQSLDVLSSERIKTYPPESGSLHWGALVDDADVPLRIRWQGKVKPLAPGRTLAKRYASLVDSEVMGSPSGRNMVSARERLGDVVLWLREAALRYHPQKSWFAGYLRPFLRHRRMDEWRATERDPLHRGEPTDTSLADDLGSSSSLPRATAPAAVPLQARDRQRLLSALLSKCSPLQKGILREKMDGATDAEAARRLGVTRECVNRNLTCIKRLSAELQRAPGGPAPA